MARTSPTEPVILEMPAQRMAVVRTKGDPNVVFQTVLGALYGSVYTLKFQMKKAGADFKVGALRARWPDAHLAPKDQWTAVWGLPVPEGVVDLPQKVVEVPVSVETWEYGTVAQVLHLGPYTSEAPTVSRLHDFIAASGHEIAGSHEEEYLTRPGAKVQKTLIRYPVRKRS